MSDTCAVRYSCLRELGTNRYKVQSLDYHHLPLRDADARLFERQFAELIAEGVESGDWFDSLDAAVAAYDAEFL